MDPLPLMAALALLGPVAGSGVVMAAHSVAGGTTPAPEVRSATTAPTMPPSPPGAALVPSATSWGPPVSPLTIVREFDAPPEDWLPGHRGVDLRAPAGTIVRAPADGVVAFTGVVAGRPVLSIDHPDPLGAGIIRTTYEPVVSRVSRGRAVRRGEVVGVVADSSHCQGGCLHLGARRGRVYVDPLSLFHGPIRLWPPDQAAG